MLGGAALLLTLLAVALDLAPQAVTIGLWGTLGAAAVADLVLSGRVRQAVTFDMPPEVFVGETMTLTIQLERMHDGLTGRLRWPEGLTGPADLAFTPDPDEGARAQVSCRAVKRGVWSFEHLWLRWQSRLGLFELVPRVAFSLELRVVPNIRLVESGEIATQVSSTLYGVKENRAIGEGSEFHQLQDFVQGMDVKNIDWKRSARKRALVAKELRAERNHHVIVALDNGYLMREEIAGMAKIDHAVTAALATAWAAAIGGDLVGLYAYDVRPNVFLAPAPGRVAFARLRSQTAALDYVGRETNHTLALSGLNARTPKRSLIIVFTDFVDTTSAELLVENIGILAKRHLVIFVTLRDPDLERKVEEAPETLNDMATLVSAHLSIKERQLVLERLARLGVTIVDAKPGQVTAQLITTYLDIKARELI